MGDIDVSRFESGHGGSGAQPRSIGSYVVQIANRPLPHSGQLDILNSSSRFASQINVKQGHGLVPIKDRRDQEGHELAGLLRGISLSGDVQRVDWSTRFIRSDKVNLSADIPDILIRLNIDADSRKETLKRQLGPTKKIGI